MVLCPERVELLLKHSLDPDIKLWMQYNSRASDMNPREFLIEPDLLAPLFDNTMGSVYHVEFGSIKAEFNGLRLALTRYEQLRKNWKATEVFSHADIFRQIT